ncbi:MAG TPA: HlyD family secretion protein [Stellaceae bacterium]|nr:HlyD family secretion protein [Stellaceae bacterium]
MRKIVVLLVVMIVLALAGGGGWRWWTVWRFEEATDDAYVQSDITVISPKIEGYIETVPVDDNQRVKKGQPLVVIDDKDFAAKVAQAEAAVSSEEAAVETDESRLELQRAMIDEAKAEVAAAEAEKARADLDYQRYKELMASDVASRQRFETAQADDVKAAAALSQKRAALVAAIGTLRVLRAQRDEEKAKRQQAAANLRLARNEFGNTIIRAPVDGVTGNGSAEPGQYVKPGSQLMVVVPLPSVYVIANFKETQLTHMRPGQPAEISVDAYPDHPIKGRIESFAPASGAEFSLLPPDNATGNFTKIVQRVPVRIALPPDNPLAQLLRPGLSVTVTVETGTRPSTASAAQESVIGRAEAKSATPVAASPR